MPNDHYVARTYLKHFGDTKLGGMLHAYSKSDGAKFPCWPKDVCHEWDGDLNPSFLDHPELLGDFRKIFEPHWNTSIENILGGTVSDSEKFVVSAYMANLMTCTPSWRRVAVQFYNQHAQGKLKLETDPNYIKAKITKQLLANALLTYNQDWLLISNETEQPFITSDNPVAIEYSGMPGEPVTRFLPITPHLCLCVTYNNLDHNFFDLENIPANLQASPKGVIKRGKIKPAEAKHINRLAAKCTRYSCFLIGRISRDCQACAKVCSIPGRS